MMIRNSLICKKSKKVKKRKEINLKKGSFVKDQTLSYIGKSFGPGFAGRRPGKAGLTSLEACRPYLGP